MKSILVLTLLISLVVSSEIFPLNFDYTKLKSISEAPEYKVTVARFELESKARANQISGNEASRNSRVTDGQLARPGQFPHHVLLIVDNTFWCGGSLIHQNWVLTAAQCLFNRAHADVYSIVSITEGYRWKSSSAAMITHENFNTPYLANNIGLVRTTSAAPFNTYISAIALPRHHADSWTGFDGTPATFTGFGIHNDEGNMSDSLRWRTLRVLAWGSCRANGLSTTELCVENRACNGNNGGGLFAGDVHNPAGRYLIGLLSFGESGWCHARNHPGVYTRLTSFIDWIDDRIARNS